MEDISKIKIPKGYIIIEDPVIKEKELKDKEIKEIEDRLKDGVPSDEELIAWGKMFHPYYEDQTKLAELKK